MKKFIHRKLTLSAEEVETAIVQWLKERDHPYPSGSEHESKFTMTADGAELAWSDYNDL